jgi:hypothetical protein
MHIKFRLNTFYMASKSISGQSYLYNLTLFFQIVLRIMVSDYLEVVINFLY